MMTPTSTRDFPHLPHRHDAPLRLRPIPYWLTLAFIGSSERDALAWVSNRRADMTMRSLIVAAHAARHLP